MKEFLTRYKYFLLVPVVIFVVMTLALLFLSSGPQTGGFVYQLH